MNKPLVILGSGGHAAVLVDILRQQNREIIGLVSPEEPINRKVFANIPYFSCDDDVLQFDKSEIKLVNGIGSLPKQNLRANIYEHFSEIGYQFKTVVDCNSIVSAYSELGEGVQVMAGAIIQTGTIIGYNSIVNTGSIVDHDCSIGSNNHIAPGVTISGIVRSGENVHFGTGASVIQSIRIGSNSIIGAGATITKNIEENVICFPARIIKKVMK